MSIFLINMPVVASFAQNALMLFISFDYGKTVIFRAQTCSPNDGNGLHIGVAELQYLYVTKDRGMLGAGQFAPIIAKTRLVATYMEHIWWKLIGSLHVSVAERTGHQLITKTFIQVLHLSSVPAPTFTL